MNTKSTIAIIAEGLQSKQAFANNLEQLCEKYDIKCNVFCCDVKGELQEPDNGYFGILKTYDSLLEAMQDFNIYSQGILVQHNKFTVGNLYKMLSDVKEDRIIDLKNSQVL